MAFKTDLMDAIAMIPYHCITGSTAVCMYLQKIDTDEAREMLATIKPHDIDIIISSKRDLIDVRRVESFVKTSGRFVSLRDIQIDVTVLSGAKSMTIDGISLHDPQQLLRIYEEYLSDIGREEKEMDDLKKIQALRYICTVLKKDTVDHSTTRGGFAKRLEF
jgi:hypothetical protein